ncbi:MAG: OsmC family protein [Candidatus Eisenbacteria bacterium]|uniref:OsmC family protein n=1 Tax=Eiseniibacteriota bacterium TaxID=2212470 RepID=A0A956NCE6_UNCEI|nr:OsmC family protein [Candidatus Eisenbacteria bacterium]
MEITFEGGKKVVAEHRGQRIVTDQPKGSGGDGSAPAPFDLFLASLGTCAGFYVLDFCQARDLPTDGIKLTQDITFDSTVRRITRIDQKIHLPAGFPEKYEAALVRSAALCAVKKHLENAPEIDVQVAR